MGPAVRQTLTFQDDPDLTECGADEATDALTITMPSHTAYTKCQDCRRPSCRLSCIGGRFSVGCRLVGAVRRGWSTSFGRQSSAVTVPALSSDFRPTSRTPLALRAHFGLHRPTPVEIVRIWHYPGRAGPEGSRFGRHCLTTPRVRPKVAQKQQLLADFQIWLDFGQIGAEFGPFRPSVAGTRQLAEFDQLGPISVRFGLESANAGRFRPHSVTCRPKSTNVGRFRSDWLDSANSGQIQPIAGNVRRRTVDSANSPAALYKSGRA